MLYRVRAIFCFFEVGTFDSKGVETGEHVFDLEVGYGAVKNSVDFVIELVPFVLINDFWPDG